MAKEKKEVKKILESQKPAIDNVNKFVRANGDALIEHYYNVIDKDSKKLVKDNGIYEYIENSEYNKELLKVSVVILTANFFECEILNYNVSKDNNIKIKKLRDGINVFPVGNFRRVDAYLLSINKKTILHLHAPETGSNTPCGSTDLVRYVCSNKYLYPSCIISFGICYGIEPENQFLCDTIIANKIYPWSIGIKIDDEKWQIKHDDYILNLNDMYTTLYYNIDQVITGKQNKEKNITFKNVTMGNMLTGEAVVSNEKIKIEAIEKAYGCKIIGGEMEGYGLAKECIYYSNIPCLILKAICDWGVCKNIDQYLAKNLPVELKLDCKGKIQAYATYCAYTVLNKLFYENIFKEKNIYEELIEDIWGKYHVNGYIQDEYLRKHIYNFIKNSINKYKKCITDDDIKNIVEILIAEYLVNEKRLTKKEDEGIIGYVFN